MKNNSNGPACHEQVAFLQAIFIHGRVFPAQDLPELSRSMNEPDPADVLAHHVLVDASGLACPMPLLKAKQALNRMQSGEVLQVVATDAGSFRDFQVFAQQSGHPLLRAIDNGDSFQYWIRKK